MEFGVLTWPLPHNPHGTFPIRAGLSVAFFEPHSALNNSRAAEWWVHALRAMGKACLRLNVSH
jgi:hypothetical protein